MTYKLQEKTTNWIVKREHLEKIFNLFKSRFPDSSPFIEIDYKSRGGTTTETFYEYQKFDEYINSEILIPKKEIEKIKILGSLNSKRKKWNKLAWLDINFRFSEATFSIVIEGTKEFNDWADGFKNEMADFFILFKATNAFTQFIKTKYTEKFQYKDSVIYLDYFDKEEKEIQSYKKAPSVINIIQSQIHTGTGDNVNGSKNMFVGKDKKN